jgi:GNAT superfamily N-acetyltransferase
VQDVDTLRAAHALDLLWVAVDSDNRPVGFVLVEMLDEDEAYIDEISVDPAHGRRGLGTSLLEAVFDWAERAGIGSIALSTFRTVPWNGPWYRKHGFRELTPEELTPEMLEIREREREAGLDVSARAFMRKPLITADA